MRLDNIPIISMLKSADGLCHKKSIAELIISLLFAWSPLLIQAFVESISGDKGYFHYLYSALDGGQIYIYICAILGALVYLIFDFSFRSKGFRHSAGFTLCIVVLTVVTLVIHVMGLVKQIPITSQDSIRKLALTIYAISLLFWWLSIVYRNIPDISLPDLDRPGRTQRQSMQDSLQDYEG